MQGKCEARSVLFPFWRRTCVVEQCKIEWTATRFLASKTQRKRMLFVLLFFFFFFFDFLALLMQVLACDWSETNFNDELERDVSSMSAYMMPGKHLPQMDDVSVLFLLRFWLVKRWKKCFFISFVCRMGGIVLAITAATDVRMLESVILIEGSRACVSSLLAFC